MKKSSALLLLFIAISVQHAFGVCLSDTSAIREHRLLYKSQSYEDNNLRFSASLKDSNGNKIEDINFKLTPSLIEYQCISRKRSSRSVIQLGQGFSIIGGYPVSVKAPNASIEMEDSQASASNVLINYYGASVNGELNIGGAVVGSDSTFALVLGAKLGFEYLTGRFDYTYNNSNLQSSNIDDYKSGFAEVYTGFKFELFGNRSDIFTLYLGKNMHVSEASNVVNNYDAGFAWSFQ